MRERIQLWGILVGLFVLSAIFVAGDPTGATLTEGDSSRRAATSATTVDAAAGNVTQLDIEQLKITAIWQGFYGNITGTITLDDANNRTFYDWAVATPTGQVYATRETVADWSNVNCTNTTNIDTEQGTLGITNTWSDSINNTFTVTNHPTFQVGGRTMDECFSTQAYNSTDDGVFWNVLISNTGSNIIYTSLITDNTNGFNNNTYDFELLVPTDYSTGLATYYFYAELQ